MTYFWRKTRHSTTYPKKKTNILILCNVALPPLSIRSLFSRLKYLLSDWEMSLHQKSKNPKQKSNIKFLPFLTWIFILMPNLDVIYDVTIAVTWEEIRVFVFPSEFALLGFLTCSSFYMTCYHHKPYDYLSFHLWFSSKCWNCRRKLSFHLPSKLVWQVFISDQSATEFKNSRRQQSNDFVNEKMISFVDSIIHS